MNPVILCLRDFSEQKEYLKECSQLCTQGRSMDKTGTKTQRKRRKQAEMWFSVGRCAAQVLERKEREQVVQT